MELIKNGNILGFGRSSEVRGANMKTNRFNNKNSRIYEVNIEQGMPTVDYQFQYFLSKERNWIASAT